MNLDMNLILHFIIILNDCRYSFITCGFSGKLRNMKNRFLRKNL